MMMSECQTESKQHVLLSGLNTGLIHRSWSSCKVCHRLKCTFVTNFNIERESAGESLQSGLGVALIVALSDRLFVCFSHCFHLC